ncbi:hypothetical protein ACFSUK_34690 [Sphingobium scionense]
MVGTAICHRVITLRWPDRIAIRFFAIFQSDADFIIGITPASIFALLGNDPDAQAWREEAQWAGGMVHHAGMDGAGRREEDMSRHSIRLAGISVVMLGAGTTPAKAQSLDDKYWIEVGAYRPSVSSHVRVAPASNPDGGTNIDLESDLDLDKHKALPQVAAGIRLGGLVGDGEYYSLSRNGSKTVARDITFDDVTYPVGCEWRAVSIPMSID